MIEEFAKKNELQKYRVEQFDRAYYQELITDLNQLTTWPKELRQKLAARGEVFLLQKVDEKVSADGKTVKVVWRRKDGLEFEGVLMRYQDGRNSVCVSCMVGCPVGCVFCATGKMGFVANLGADEIVEQVLYFARKLKGEGEEVTRVVFMGMGEPLLNLDEVLMAYRILTDKAKFGLGRRRVTISTSGYVPQLKELSESDFGGKLAVSLHAGIQEQREKLMKIASVYRLDELMKAVDFYVKKKPRRVSYEYVMIEGVNDDRRDAQKLIKLLKNRLAHVNLIPYNPVMGVGWKRSSSERIRAFANVLAAGGIEHTIRVTMGDEIQAACGQLVRKQ